jgi:CheY-like chemotaxis protein
MNASQAAALYNYDQGELLVDSAGRFEFRCHEQLARESAKPDPELPWLNETLVYAVDDTPCILELYVALLESFGCMAKAFHDRAGALSALEAEQRKPDLLITDYYGGTVPVHQFMRQSKALHPRLRILMASGVCDPDLGDASAMPDVFIPKPFTNEEFKRAVRVVLL